MDNKNESPNTSQPELTKPQLTHLVSHGEERPALTTPQFTRPTYDTPNLSHPEEALPDPFSDPETTPESPKHLEPLFPSPPQEPVIQPPPKLTPARSEPHAQATPIRAVSPPPAPRTLPRPIPSRTPPPPPQKKSHIGKIILILIGLLLLCCCLGGIGKWLWDNGDELIGYTSMVLSSMRLI